MLVAVVVLMTAAPAGSQDEPFRTFSVYGPAAYERRTGKPQTIVETFSVQDPSARYILKASNGTPGGAPGRISSALIRVNGIEVLGPARFGQQVDAVEAPVVLDSINEIAVEVRGKPGGTLVVEVLGIDHVPPAITASVNPEPNGNGWHNTDVTVVFTCGDATSGIAACPLPVTVSADGAGQVIGGTAVDRAGNTATASVTVNVDKTPPTLVTVVGPEPNGNGWHNGDATVGFACADATSGVASCPQPVVVSEEGAGQVVGGAAVDRAGNAASASASVNLDKTPPAVTVTWPPPVFSTDRPSIEITGGLSDALSGVARAILHDAFGEAALPIPSFAVTRDLQTSTAPGQAPRANPLHLEVQDLAGNRGEAQLLVRHTLDSFMPRLDPARAERRGGVLSSVDRALVGFEASVGRERIHQILGEEGGRVSGYLTTLNMAQVVFDTDHVSDLDVILERIRMRPEIAAALPAFFLESQVFDNELLAAAEREAYDSVRLQDAADLISGGSLPFQRTGVAIIDSGLGLDYGRANEFAGVTFVDLCAEGGGVSRPAHGAGVTGVIAGANNGEGNNGIVSGFAGSGFAVTVYGTGCGADERMDGALIALATDDILAGRLGEVHVVNLSFMARATEPGLEAGLEAYYEHFFGSTRGVDILWVASAGNDDMEVACAPGGFPVYPAALACLLPNVVAVGGHDPAGDVRWLNSNHGPAITVYAPGLAHTATAPGAYGNAAGTSLAAPMVTGAAALLYATHPQSPSSLKRLLRETARPLADPALAQGGLDVLALLQAGQPPPTAPLLRHTFNGTADGDSILLPLPRLIPGLAGFDLDFDVSEQRVDTVAAGFRQFEDNPDILILVDFSDSNDDDEYDWTIYRQELPAGTTIHQVSERGTNITKLLDHPLGMQAVPVLLGFHLDAFGANIAVESVRVRLYTSFNAFYLTVIYPQDEPGFDDRFRYTVTYALVPLDRVAAIGDLGGFDAGGSDSATLNAEQPVLQGFELKFRNGPNFLDRFHVRLRPGRADLSFRDEGFDDPYDWRLWWVDVE
jgi:hypothetical protein